MTFLTPLNPPLIDWRAKTVWVVGASSGIGRATASALHAQGARVIVSARKAQALEDFVLAHPGSLISWSRDHRLDLSGSPSPGGSICFRGNPI
jgi:NAD(P)-dependent dehydrogenase (short-subunit alcohol dehydrogenase family)